MLKRLAIITTHPIQYYAPIFRQLGKGGAIAIKVFYTWPQSQKGQYDPGFGKTVEWDVPLLDGYEYTFVENTAKKPTSSSFWGIHNPTLIEEIAEWEPDALLVFSWSYRSNIAVLRYFKGKIPIFFRGDSHLLDEVPGLRTALRRTVLSWVYRHVDFVFYVGENNRQYFLKHGVKPGQLILAPHVVDNNRFAAGAAHYEENAVKWRSELAIPGNALVYVYAGKLAPKKDPHLLLRVFTELSSKISYLVIVGNGPMESELKESYQHHPRIRFVDFQNQSQMPVVYRLGDVFVLPSRGPAETWGLAVNEAMACSRPVVASNKVGGAVDLIKPGRNGYIFEAGNAASLKETLEALEEKSLTVIKAMGAESSEIIKSWSLENLVHCLEQGVLTGLQASPEVLQD